MITDVKSVGVDDDQETVAQLLAKYHYLAIPVLDRDGRLVGVVDADRVIRVIQQEATEDMHRMVGLSGEEHAYTPWQQAIGRRLAWLYINLATAFLAGAVVALFESTIARWTALAVFLPIIAGQGGNSGMQTLTVVVRGMALGEVPRDLAMKVLGKEIVMGLLNGLAIGLITGLLGYWWRGDAVLGLVVGLGMLLNMLAAALSGILIPMSLRCLRIDPALASSIILTTITDVVVFFAFLGLAALAMKMQ
jgi:magnesium transporter